MDIRQIRTGKKCFLDLLLLADEQETMIDRYLDRGDMFVVFEGATAIAESVVTDEGNGVFELKSLAVLPSWQRKGYGRRLIDFLWMHYAGRCRTMQVGTGESPLTVPFYEQCGFRYTHRIPDFFITHYDHPIIEAGQQLTDMVYLQKSDEGDPALHDRLAGHLSKKEIQALARQAETDTACRHHLFGFLFATDRRISENAAWTFTHFSPAARHLLLPHRDALTDEAMRCDSATKRRLLLTLLNRLPVADPIRTDFLDFCLHTLLSTDEPHGIRSLCIKLSAAMCRRIPELQRELRLTLEMLKGEPLPSSLRCVLKRI